MTPIDPILELREQAVETNGVSLNVATVGGGPPVLLLHGWPHTWRVWALVLELMAKKHLCVAPDLRGLGASTRAAAGYDLHTLADDLVGLLEALALGPVLVVGLDLGVAIACMLALRHPAKVRGLVVMEGLVGDLPGAEAFLRAGPPWWFGFHAMPGLAETVLEGHEGAYLDWFYRAGTWNGRGVGAERDAFVRAYTGWQSLRCGFEHYRQFATNAVQLRVAASQSKFSMPVLSVAGGIVGDAVGRQIEPIASKLSKIAIAESGHIIPLDQPAALAAALMRFYLQL